MHIKLSPIRKDTQLILSRKGDTLIVNGESFDFSQLADGSLLPREAIDSVWFASDVERIDGELHLTLLLPHGGNAGQATRFPEPVHSTKDGAIRLPAYNMED